MVSEMCTVAFVPQPDGGYLLGHNRDETVARASGIPPAVWTGPGLPFLAPRDPEGGGSWIAVNAAGLAVCLLNAMDRPSRPIPTRPVSRGLLVVEAARLDSILAVAAWLLESAPRFESFRAFHLLAVEPGRRPGDPARVARLRFEGGEPVLESKTGAALFVSSGYDPAGAERERESCWSRFLAASGPPGRDPLARWLASHDPEPGPSSVCMHRPEARTVSRTIVSVAADRVEMDYLEGSPCSPSSPEISCRLPRYGTAAFGYSRETSHTPGPRKSQGRRPSSV
jgi:hypothetical protein